MRNELVEDFVDALLAAYGEQFDLKAAVYVTGAAPVQVP